MYQKSAPKTGTRKPVGLPVSDMSDVQFGTEFFWYQFLVTNKTCFIFVPVYGTSFLVRLFGADFWYACHGQYGDDGDYGAVVVVGAV